MGRPTMQVVPWVLLFLAHSSDLVLASEMSPKKKPETLEQLAAERGYHEANIMRFLGDPLPVHEARTLALKLPTPP